MTATRPTIFLRREPTADMEALLFGPDALRLDVVAYRTSDATERVQRWPWHDEAKPRKGGCTVYLDGVEWRPTWLPDLNQEQQAAEVIRELVRLLDIAAIRSHWRARGEADCMAQAVDDGRLFIASVEARTYGRPALKRAFG